MKLAIKKQPRVQSIPNFNRMSYLIVTGLRMMYSTIGLFICYLILNEWNKVAQHERIWGYSIPQFLFLTIIVLYIASLFFAPPPKIPDRLKRQVIPLYSPSKMILTQLMQPFFRTTIIVLIMLIGIQIWAILPVNQRNSLFDVPLSQFLFMTVVLIYLVFVILYAIYFGIKKRRLQFIDPQIAEIMVITSPKVMKGISSALIGTIILGISFMTTIMTGDSLSWMQWFTDIQIGHFTPLEFRLILVVMIAVAIFLALCIIYYAIIPRSSLKNVNAIAQSKDGILPSPSELVTLVQQQLAPISRINAINSNKTIYPIIPPELEESADLMPSKEFKKSTLIKTLIYIGLAVGVYLFVQFVPVFDISL